MTATNIENDGNNLAEAADRIRNERIDGASTHMVRYLDGRRGFKDFGVWQSAAQRQGK